jgi:Xaa-Pro aminopeptidase
MEDAKQRLTASISLKELERRWKAARELMKERKIDYLLLRNDEEFMGGYVRWFTDLPARHSYPFTVIFPLQEEMSLISVGPFPPGEPAPPAWAARGVKRRLSAPYFPSAQYTYKYDAEVAVGVLKEKTRATIGLVGPSFIPMNFHRYLVDHLPGAQFVDMTEEIDQIKAVKSEEELGWIRKAAALQDAAIQHVKRILKPGMRDFEVYAEAHYSATRLGSERGLILVGSGPRGEPAPFQFRHFQNRIIREGDQVSVLIEVNGPGGFYTEISRIFSLGKPSQELVDAFGYAVEAQKHTLSMLRPGANPREILQSNNVFLQKKGYKPELRLYAHGQGYDLVERPFFLADETLTIQPGMNLTIHPTACNDQVWAGICDNYLMTESGPGECLHQTPKEIIVVS